MMANLQFGTCSWKYPSWQGIVYSSAKPENFLEEYAQHFKSVEIDQWFWSLFGIDQVKLPSPTVAKQYANSVPDDFSFTIKVPNSITLTHFYKKRKNDPLIANPYFLSADLFHEFLDMIEPLHEKIGALMFQFEYLNRQKMESEQEFLEKMDRFLSEIAPDFPYALEIRNPNYLNRSYFRFLQERSLAHVFLQGYYMPSITKIFRQFSDFLADFTVIRLHGPDRSEIEAKSGGSWNRIWEEKGNELQEIARIIQHLLRDNRKIFVNVNNHYEGSAPLTIKRLEKFLQTTE